MSSASQQQSLDTVANALRGLQLHNAQLETRNRDLERQNIQLEAERCEQDKRAKKERKASRAAKGKARGDKSTSSNASGGVAGNAAGGVAAKGAAETEKIMNAFQCGKYFVCGGELWVRPSALALFTPPLEKPAMVHDDPNRYQIVTPQLTLMGARADLYHLVPERLHESMASFVLFQEEFRRGMTEGRSTFVASLRRQLPVLCGLSPTYFMVPNAERRREAKVVKYLKFDVNAPEYPDLPPIIFPDLQYDVKMMFRNTILIQALGVVLRGNSFVTSPGQGGIPDPNCKLWGVSTVTGTMIANIATMVIHLLSPGLKFQENNTIIDLYRINQLLKQLIITGQNNPYIKETIQIYQQEIFGGNSTTEHIDLEPQGESSGNVASNLLRDLWAETPEAPPAAAPAPAPAAEAPPPHSSPRSVPEPIVVNDSSGSESSEASSSESDSESSGSDSSGSESSSSEDKEGSDKAEDEDEEGSDKAEDEEGDGVVVDLDEEAEGTGTDYEDVYVNLVSAPNSTKRASSSRSRTVEPVESPSPVAAATAPAHATALPIPSGPPAPVIPPHSIIPGPALDAVVAVALDATLPIAAEIPAPLKLKRARKPRGAQPSDASPALPAPIAGLAIGGEAVVVTQPVADVRQLRTRHQTTAAVAASDGEPKKDAAAEKVAKKDKTSAKTAKDKTSTKTAKDKTSAKTAKDGAGAKMAKKDKAAGKKAAK